MELQPLNNNPEPSAKEQVAAANGVEEAGCLLQVHVSNEKQHSAEEAGLKQTTTLKEQLNEVVFWRVRLWMVILFIIFLIVCVILISLALCTAIHEDVDDKFDPASFKVPLCFNGSLRLPNHMFSEELRVPTSNQSRTLSTHLLEKLTLLYSSSPALGRYFTTAEIPAFSNGSVVARYQLTFRMPEQNEQLKSFTLSRELVYNVLRQHLYDQEPEDQGPLYIDPASLEMHVSHQGISS